MRVTRGGFYAWLRRELSTRAQRDLVLCTKLRAFHAASGHRCGRARLWRDLREDGEAVSEKCEIPVNLASNLRMSLSLMAVSASENPTVLYSVQ
jgi:hypothetical protein